MLYPEYGYIYIYIPEYIYIHIMDITSRIYIQFFVIWGPPVRLETLPNLVSKWLTSNGWRIPKWKRRGYGEYAEGAEEQDTLIMSKTYR
jgi:hypothetical protein